MLSFWYMVMVACLWSFSLKLSWRKCCYNYDVAQLVASQQIFFSKVKEQEQLCIPLYDSLGKIKSLFNRKCFFFNLFISYRYTILLQFQHRVFLLPFLNIFCFILFWITLHHDMKYIKERSLDLCQTWFNYSLSFQDLKMETYCFFEKKMRPSLLLYIFYR